MSILLRRREFIAALSGAAAFKRTLGGIRRQQKAAELADSPAMLSLE